MVLASRSCTPPDGATYSSGIAVKALLLLLAGDPARQVPEYFLLTGLARTNPLACVIWSRARTRYLSFCTVMSFFTDFTPSVLLAIGRPAHPDNPVLVGVDLDVLHAAEIFGCQLRLDVCRNSRIFDECRWV